MRQATTFQVGRFVERFVTENDMECGFFDDLSKVGFRLLNNDMFYFQLEPCMQKIIMFFSSVKPCVLTSHEIVELNESLGFAEINSKGRVVVSDEYGLVYFNVKAGGGIDAEFLESSVVEFLSGYKKLNEFIKKMMN